MITDQKMTSASPSSRRAGIHRVDCIVGARPNFMKIAPILRAFEAADAFSVRLIHTGQHYDEAMNAVFFEELGIPEPDINLGAGSGTHTEQTARIMLGLEPVLVEDRPDLLLVVGDVNSTVAAALVASKLLIPLAHVEAGLRSNDRTMPEEINRLVTDRLSSLLLTTERDAIGQLVREGVAEDSIHFAGNVMIDALYANLSRAQPARETIARLTGSGEFLKQSRSGFGFVTLHRPSNVDDPVKLAGLLGALSELARQLPLVFAMHPRTRDRIDKAQLWDRLDQRCVLVTPPLTYLEMIGLMKEARLAVTDSGGVQEETTALGVPCLTVRDNTERPITISEGTNTLVGSSPPALLAAAYKELKTSGKRGRIPELWDGRAAERIVTHVTDFIERYKAA